MFPLMNFTKHSRKNLYQFYSNSSKNRRQNTSKTFYEATITLISKPDKDNTRKENYRTTSLVSIDPKPLKRILANQIRQSVKRIIHHDKQYIFHECKFQHLQINPCDTHC